MTYLKILPLATCALCILITTSKGQWSTSVYEQIRQDPELNGFNIILGTNVSSRAERLLNFYSVTVFAPENSAFRRYKDELYSELIFYHVVYGASTVEDLKKNTNSLKGVAKDNPPLWIKVVDEDDVYVNDARIITEKSNVVFRGRSGELKQILHVIDGVLNPLIRSPSFSPNAYDFISNPFNWDLGTSISVSSFFSKVQETNLQYIFKQGSGHTFFVPLNFGMDPYKFTKMDTRTILAHVVPFYVLFTTPTKKDFAYESLANENNFYVVVSFVEKTKKLYVKATVRDNKDQNDFYSEIIVRNIPLKNGVVHLIAQPLGIPNRPLKPFPYLPIMSKLSSDPTLDMFFKMGEVTKFNEIFQREDVRFTYFIPRDTAWNMAKNMSLDAIEDDLTILKRHLVLSETPYSIEQLEAQTKANNNSFLELTNAEGVLKIMVLKIEDIYYVKWFNKYIEVLRSNYECTNGMIHILAGPMANFRRSDIKVEEYDFEKSVKNIEQTYWKMMKKAWNKINL